MRILLDNEGYVSKWMEKDDAGCLSDNDFVIATPEGFDFATFREDSRYYKGVDGVLVKDENRVIPEREQPAREPTQLDRVEAQVVYTAMMTDTLLEV